MSKILPTFCKHIIVINLDNIGWILELGAKKFVRWINCIRLLQMKGKQTNTQICNQQYQRYEGKKTKVQNKKLETKDKIKELTYFKFFVNVLFMGKDLLINKMMVSIQLFRNNML